MKKIISLTFILFIFGCASKRYQGTSKWKENNTITIISDNLKGFNIVTKNKNVEFTLSKGNELIITKCKKNNCTNKESSKIISTSDSKLSTSILMENFKRKGVDLLLTHPNYDTVKIEVKRGVRYDALTKDIALSLITYGIPLIVDVFKSDFYKVKKDSKKVNVHFEYSQSFMRDEYNKISKSNEVNELDKWISRFPKSEIRQLVINHKDSLELINALAEQKESSIDVYISSHVSSKFIDQAKKIKEEMKEARESFQNAKITNSIESYEFFLSKYPKSIHNREAHALLLNAAEKKVLESEDHKIIFDYIANYLEPNKEFINNDEFSDKKERLTRTIENIIFKQNITNNSLNKYIEYSNLWKSYIEIIRNGRVNQYLTSFPKITEYYAKICDELFNGLKKIDTEENQNKWNEKTQIDFPYLEEEKEFYNQASAELTDFLIKNKGSKNNIYFIILNLCKNADGKIKLHNVNYLKNFSGKDWTNYTYKQNKFEALDKSDYEELNFSKGKLFGASFSYTNKLPTFSISFDKNKIITEISYYQEGKIIKTLYFLDENNFYEYEFEKGVNLTLKDLDDKIAEGKGFMKTQSYEDAISVFEKARNNNLPNNSTQNVILDNSILTAKDELSKKQILNDINRDAMAKWQSQARGVTTQEDISNYVNSLKPQSEENKTKNQEQIKESYCINMNGQKYKVILYESGGCDYILFNNYGEVQKSLSGKWTRRNLGVYGGWTITITFDHGSSAFKCQMNGYGDIQALIDDLGNFWQKCN
jgi:hypothetical protein